MAEGCCCDDDDDDGSPMDELPMSLLLLLLLVVVTVAGEIMLLLRARRGSCVAEALMAYDFFASICFQNVLVSSTEMSVTYTCGDVAAALLLLPAGTVVLVLGVRHSCSGQGKAECCCNSS